MVTSEIIGAICNRMTVRVIRVVVGPGTRESVVSNKLEPLAEALIYFRLKCVVVGARIIAIVVLERISNPVAGVSRKIWRA